MLKNSFLCCMLVSVCQLANASTDWGLQNRINIIGKQADSLTFSKSQLTRQEVAQAIFDSLDNILTLEESYLLNFDSFKTVSIQQSEDKHVKIFTWNYFSDSGDYTVFGILQLNPKYHEEFYYPLTAINRKFDTAHQVLGVNEWYPALYYNIYNYKYKRKCYYILTGLHGRNAFLNERVVECLILDKNEEPVFGKAIFYGKDARKQPLTRLIYKYAEEATMVCRVEPTEQMLVVSSLVPVRWQRKGDYEYYTPDGTYDYYQYKKGNWYFAEELNEFGKIGNKKLNGKFKTE